MDLTLAFLLKFIGLSVTLAGSAAWASGRAIAQSWTPIASVVPAAIALAFVARFIDYALFATPFSWGHLAVDAVVTTGLAVAGYVVTRSRQMRTQYPWLVS